MLNALVPVLPEMIGGSADLTPSNGTAVKSWKNFAAGEYGVLFDPRGWLTIVRGNPASALEGLGLSLGDRVWIS